MGSPEKPPLSPEDTRKDTSLPGREEEVIVNSEEQSNITNAGQKEPAEPTSSNNTKKDRSPSLTPEETFKEGLANNSGTEEIPDTEEK
jgi:hypothetical protein